MAADFEAVARQFVEFYYKTFDSGRQNLAALYRDQSMLTFEGQPMQGVTAIVEKLTGLPFEKVEHQVATLDAQPTQNGINVVVTGRLITDNESNAMSFTQTFQLVPDAGSYFVSNDIFRLIYGA